MALNAMVLEDMYSHQALKTRRERHAETVGRPARTSLLAVPAP